jgi:hypothetical protein
VGWTDPRSVHVVGISMGGMISQELVRSHRRPPARPPAQPLTLTSHRVSSCPSASPVST